MAFIGLNWSDIFKILLILDRFEDRGDSMIWVFIDRRPLPVKDYVVSIEDGPKF